MMATKQQMPSKSTPALTPTRGSFLQRTCACSNQTMKGECERCGKEKQTLGIESEGDVPSIAREVMRSSGQPLDPATRTLRALTGSRFGHDFSRIAVHEAGHRSDNPGKAVGIHPEDDDKEKPRPTQGSATIQCNGGGDYEIAYGSWAGATCGTKDCVTMHESSHMADWKAKWPTGCKGQPKGYLPKGDAPDSPLMTVSEYKAFLKESECTAHTADLACAEALPQPAACKKTVEDYIKLTKNQKARWCPSLSRIAKVAIGILAGAGLGAVIGGLLGATAIGAGIGAVVGGIAGLFS
jgi:hypothetical protein